MGAHLAFTYIFLTSFFSLNPTTYIPLRLPARNPHATLNVEQAVLPARKV
jgi:hypothetical protein